MKKIILMLILILVSANCRAILSDKNYYFINWYMNNYFINGTGNYTFNSSAYLNLSEINQTYVPYQNAINNVQLGRKNISLYGIELGQHYDFASSLRPMPGLWVRDSNTSSSANNLIFGVQSYGGVERFGVEHLGSIWTRNTLFKIGYNDSLNETTLRTQNRGLNVSRSAWVNEKPHPLALNCSVVSNGGGDPADYNITIQTMNYENNTKVAKVFSSNCWWSLISKGSIYSTTFTWTSANVGYMHGKTFSNTVAWLQTDGNGTNKMRAYYAPSPAVTLYLNCEIDGEVHNPCKIIFTGPIE